MSKKDNINEKIEQIDKIIMQFENGEIELGGSVEKYEEALSIAKSVQEDLEKMKNQVEVLSKDDLSSRIDL